MTSAYALPASSTAVEALSGTVYTVASGDLRPAANLKCWPTQQRLESDFQVTVEKLGWDVVRAHPFDPERGHGFIDSQRMGMTVFRNVPPTAPVVVVDAVWQYSHHVLAGLRSHRGPILLVANWAGDFPGLVGMLNFAGSLTKAGIAYSRLWSADFTDSWAVEGLRTWLETGVLVHNQDHVRSLPELDAASPEVELGAALARQLMDEKAIVGVFDEGCMGMYNAIIDDELLNPLGVYKERLSQSALLAEMATVTDAEAEAVRAWLDDAGMTFHFGTDEATELTPAQVHVQLKIGRSTAIVASWARYDEAIDEKGEPIAIVDALADTLVPLARSQREHPLAFVENREVFGDLVDDRRFTTTYLAVLKSLHARGARATLEDLDHLVGA